MIWKRYGNKSWYDHFNKVILIREGNRIYEDVTCNTSLTFVSQIKLPPTKLLV